ncbi:unnamed protein product [Peronospora farinosa]|uniref:Transposase n=1 Tax=Peronospora farinosa TaxID=134698 RepID=A0AAV0T9U2_9STRA|nr:unnamed protein product [Peronospora farinosa]CAI5717734.1 unnamed protein product [Peronospora farinosa]CAI5717829.1 unnamed protein product [Peronospora farinosa]
MQLQSMEERFNPDTLKTRIVEFFADADIAFSIVEKQSFHDLIGFLNKKAESMLVQQEALKNHATDIYIATRDIVIEKMKKDIRGVDVIHFTTDCWTTKGKNYGFLSLTGHWVDAKFELHQSLLGLKNVEGSHEGKNLEKYYYKMVAENFGLLNVHGHATVDNGSNNSTLFEAFGRRDDVIFDKEDKMHICVAHVLKLVARDGLAQFGIVDDDEDDEVVVERSAMSIGAIVDRPDGADVSIETVYQRIKGFATFVNGSTQRKEQFACAVKLQQPNSHAVAVIGDVSTRWNSTYQMFLRALQLR